MLARSSVSKTPDRILPGPLLCPCFSANAAGGLVCLSIMADLRSCISLTLAMVIVIRLGASPVGDPFLSSENTDNCGDVTGRHSSEEHVPQSG